MRRSFVRALRQSPQAIQRTVNEPIAYMLFGMILTDVQGTVAIAIEFADRAVA